MRSHPKSYFKVLAILFALTLSQCGQKTKSQDVHITASPSSPIVFTTDVPITQGGAPATVKAPWFSMTVQIDNESDTPVTIIVLHVEVTGTDATGAQTTNMIDLAPATDNITLNSVACVYSDYGEFEQKGVAGNFGSLNEQASASGCSGGPVTFYVGGNPLPASTSQIRYSVKIVPEGYFGKRGTPTDRFDGFATVFTQ